MLYHADKTINEAMLINELLMIAGTSYGVAPTKQFGLALTADGLSAWDMPLDLAQCAQQRLSALGLQAVVAPYSNGHVVIVTMPDQHVTSAASRDADTVGAIKILSTRLENGSCDKLFFDAALRALPTVWVEGISVARWSDRALRASHNFVE